MKVYNSIEELIGKTPILRLSGVEKELGLSAKLFAKLEYLNPAGSVKDRAAKGMLDDALEKGLIDENSVIIEPTSGNTGIGLASIGAARGYRTIIVMPETMSEERKMLMRAYGAELVLTEGAKGMKGAIEKANELAGQLEGSFIPNQFENLANARAHYNTTAPEIWEDMDGNIDYFVAGIGSGGSISGIGKYLKEKNSNIRIVGVEPSKSPFLTRGESGAHKIQGIGAGFLPKGLDTESYDEVLTVENEEAFEMGRLIAQKEGVLVGISSGAALCAGVRIARGEEARGKNIVILLPDTGDRYLSTEMFK